MDKKRCEWVDIKNDIYLKYHDEEWGVPVHDDRKLFEMLVLEGMQAGLSWLTILKKRENFKKLFNNFKPEIIAGYNEDKINELCNNPGIIRNRLKIESAVSNSEVFLKIKKEFGSFNNYIWDFVNNRPVNNKYKKLSEIPAKTELSETISKDLKMRGMKFAGPAIIYAFMQAIGIVNDHICECFRYGEILEFYKK
jgi:DNA-3-methyladenine glycosylase I